MYSQRLTLPEGPRPGLPSSVMPGPDRASPRPKVHGLVLRATWGPARGTFGEVFVPLAVLSARWRHVSPPNRARGRTILDEAGW